MLSFNTFVRYVCSSSAGELRQLGNYRSCRDWGSINVYYGTWFGCFWAHVIASPLFFLGCV
jgi:hypothetical protein